MAGLRALAGLGIGLLAATAAPAVEIDFVTIWAPGNAPDTQVMDDMTTGYGAVDYTYRIGRVEVSNLQYMEFLNAVAQTDTFGLWKDSMGTTGGISRSGSDGSYVYTERAGLGNLPVNDVTWYDAIRFANWLHNGQPVGAQDATTTEDGAYTTVFENYSQGPVVVRNPGAQVFLPSEDEWYKAAYYDPHRDVYYDFPFAAGIDIGGPQPNLPVCEFPVGGAISANCDSVEPVNGLIPVGSYKNAYSPFFILDQGGNVQEWNEAVIVDGRGRRGGSWFSLPFALRTANRLRLKPALMSGNLGFRVAAAPEPGPLSMGGMALGCLLALQRSRSARARRAARDARRSEGLADPSSIR